MVNIEQKYKELLKTWSAETGMSSRIETGHPAYRAIVALGPDVAPFVIQSIRTGEAGWLFCVLAEIFPGEVLIPDSSSGKICELELLWIDWWERKYPPSGESLYDAADDLVNKAITKLEDRLLAGEHDPIKGFSSCRMNRFSWIEGAIEYLEKAVKYNKQANKILGLDKKEYNSGYKERDELKDLHEENRILRAELSKPT